jgi:hypothetical protein
MFAYSNGFTAVNPPVTKQSQSIAFWIRRIERNVRTPHFLLRRLAASASAELRTAVGEHKNAPNEVLQKLASDESDDVRFSLAENHNLDKQILELLSVDANPYVAQRASRTLSRAYPNISASFSVWPLAAALA